MRNYYEDLQVSEKSSFDDIAEAFRRLVRQGLDQYELNRAAEAYEVLSDIKKRKWYDQFGEFSLKEGFTVNNSCICGYRFIGNTSEILLKFFGTEWFLLEPFGAELEKKVEEQPPENVVVEVLCTLEETFNGCRKSIECPAATGVQWKTIEICPGCESGHKFIYYGEGRSSQNYSNSNLVLIVKEIPHKVYQRFGNNLIANISILLIQALSGAPVELVLLNYKKHFISFDKVISHKTEVVFSKMGMLGKGTLTVKINVIFPKVLSGAFKEKLQTLLV